MTRQQRYRLAHPDRRRASYRKWREKNRDKVRAYKRKSYANSAAHREALERDALRRQLSPARRKEQQRAWKIKNRDRINSIQNERRAALRPKSITCCYCGQEILEWKIASKKWHKSCFVKSRTPLKRTWFNSNRETLWPEKLAYQRKYRDGLPDAHIRGLLLGHEDSLTAKDFPPEIVELKRKQIRLLRAIKQRKVNTCTLNTSAA